MTDYVMGTEDYHQHVHAVEDVDKFACSSYVENIHKNISRENLVKIVNI